MLFISDGILDHTDRTGKAFGLAGVLQAVRGATDRSAATMLRAIQDAAQAFTDAPFTDDATLMVLAPSHVPGQARRS